MTKTISKIPYTIKASHYSDNVIPVGVTNRLSILWSDRTVDIEECGIDIDEIRIVVYNKEDLNYILYGKYCE